MLFSEPKIPQYFVETVNCGGDAVSVLFSEPKIPQFRLAPETELLHLCFSALQRAENSSIAIAERADPRGRSFSALQRAENSSIVEPDCEQREPVGFSALQRAENSSI